MERERPNGGRWLSPRLVGVAAVLAAAMLTITGCTGVPDRTDLAADITTELRNLSGVDDVAGDYLNGMTTGQSYNVRVQFTDEVTADEVKAFVSLYYSRIGEQALDGHTSSLHAAIGGASIAYFSGRTRSAPSLTVFDRWYALAGQLDAPFSWGISSDGSLNLIQYEPEGIGLDVTVAHLRSVAPTLQQDVHWIIRSHRTRLAMRGAYLQTPAARLAAEFASTNRQWDIDANSAVTPGLQMAVWKSEAEALEPTARADLRQIAALNVPVRYTLKVGGGPHLVVFVGGCQSDSTGLQQQLNAEFGAC